MLGRLGCSLLLGCIVLGGRSAAAPKSEVAPPAFEVVEVALFLFDTNENRLRPFLAREDNWNPSGQLVVRVRYHGPPNADAHGKTLELNVAHNHAAPVTAELEAEGTDAQGFNWRMWTLPQTDVFCGTLKVTANFAGEAASHARTVTRVSTCGE